MKSTHALHLAALPLVTILTALPAAAQQTAIPQTPATAPPIPAPVAPSQSAPTDAVAPLSLEESIRIALRRHGDPRASAQGFEAARQGVTSARAALFPEVAANAGTNYRNGSRTTTTTTDNSGTTVISSGSTTTGFSVSQNIFDGGRTRQRINQANARALGAAGTYGNARNSLAFNVAAAFFDQLRQGKLVAQREGQVALAAQQLEAINAQIEAGTTARADAQTVQVTLSQARFDLATARNNLGTAQVNFRNTLGLGAGPALQLRESPLAAEAGLPQAAPSDPALASAAEAVPSTVEAVPSSAEALLLAPLPSVPQLKPLADYLAEAGRLRPDLLQSRATVQSGEAAINLAQIERRPQVSASANYDIDPRDTGSRGFRLGAGLSIPIFDAGGRRADVRAAQADQEANRARLGQLEKDVAADVESSYVEISGEVGRIANARILVEQARVNLDNASEKYRLGLGTVLDITNAQTQLFSAQTSLTSAVYDFELARANLDRAVGRFAWADPGQAPAAAPSNLQNAIAALQATAPTTISAK